MGAGNLSGSSGKAATALNNNVISLAPKGKCFVNYFFYRLFNLSLKKIHPLTISYREEKVLPLKD